MSLDSSGVNRAAASALVAVLLLCGCLSGARAEPDSGGGVDEPFGIAPQPISPREPRPRAQTWVVSGVVVTPNNGPAQGPMSIDLSATMARIERGESHSHRNDGSVFRNRPPSRGAAPLLPLKPEGYYREYVHPTPGIGGPGPQRVVLGENGEVFYTPDHYLSFVRVR